MTFTELTLHDRLQRAIAAAGYQTPTPIQQAAIPIIRSGADLVGTAQTGTGKTAAFVLPLLDRLLSTPTNSRKTRVLILAPTRELAEQIHNVIRQLGRHTNVRSAPVYGGVGMLAQERALKNGTEIIVACPGRLLDHVQRGNVDFDDLECLVLDEADRMLDMGFMPDIIRLLRLLPTERQTLLFSATFAPELNDFVAEHLRTPERLEVDPQVPVGTVAHVMYPVMQPDKLRLLTTLLAELETTSVLIFTRTRERADQVARGLLQAGLDAGVLHSNKTQAQRQFVMDRFRTGAHPYLVATDIAARGIDVASISHVINFDVPENAEDYLHRIGRTGRAERDGMALTFVTAGDARTIYEIERMLNEPMKVRFAEGFTIPELPPAPARRSGRRPARPRPAAARPRPAGPARPQPRDERPAPRPKSAERPAPKPAAERAKPQPRPTEEPRRPRSHPPQENASRRPRDYQPQDGAPRRPRPRRMPDADEDIRPPRPRHLAHQPAAKPVPKAARPGAPARSAQEKPAPRGSGPRGPRAASVDRPPRAGRSRPVPAFAAAVARKGSKGRPTAKRGSAGRPGARGKR